MTNLPSFIAVDYAELNDTFIPVSIAWSLPDGQIKHTIICPSEEWEDDLYDAVNVDITHLTEQGASTKEVLYELNADIEDSTLYCFDSYCDEASLNTLYEAASSELAYELAPWTEAIDTSSSSEVYDNIQWQRDQHALDESLAEDRVKLMLFTYNELTQSSNL